MEEKVNYKKRKLSFNIEFKATLIIIVLALLIVFTSMVYFSITEKRENESRYKNLANNLSSTVSEVVNVPDYIELRDKVLDIYEQQEKKPTSEEWGSPDWNEYTSKFAEIYEDPVFIRTRDFLRKLVDANPNNDVNCFYLIYVDVARELCVYIVDSAPDEEACPPGCIDSFSNVNKPVLKDPEYGFPAYTNNSQEYGWLVTAGSAIHNGNEVVGYAVVDISMAAINAKHLNNIATLFLFLFLSVVAVCIIGIIIVHLVFGNPVRKLKRVAESYDKDDPETTHRNFVNLNMNTHDEVSDLAESMKKMESDVYNQINQLILMNKELEESQKEAREMTALANKDGLTGVQNKIAYNREEARINALIKEGKMEPFGIAMIDLNYLKNTNDEFGHDAGDDALIKLAHLICIVFAHSPVYRTGGDEFVVILTKHDFNHSKSLIKSFNTKNKQLMDDDTLPDAERISAAIGYAIFNPKEDTSVEDVFKRADKFMYERKRKMKGE